MRAVCQLVALVTWTEMGAVRRLVGNVLSEAFCTFDETVEHRNLLLWFPSDPSQRGDIQHKLDRSVTG